MKLRKLTKELNLFGLNRDWKVESLRDYLNYNGYDIVSEDWGEYEYSDIKAYMDISVKKI